MKKDTIIYYSAPVSVPGHTYLGQVVIGRNSCECQSHPFDVYQDGKPMQYIPNAEVPQAALAAAINGWKRLAVHLMDELAIPNEDRLSILQEHGLAEPALEPVAF